MAAQFAEEREEIIMDFLRKQGSIHIGDVTDILKISPSTARLLLQKMQDKGMLRRTHGGAIPIRKPELQSMQAVDPNEMIPGTDTATGTGEFPGPLSAGTALPGAGSAASSQVIEPEKTMGQGGDPEAGEPGLSMKIRHHFGQIKNLEKKWQIAAAAAGTVQDGDLISLGSGTTTWLMATLLHGRKDLTVVTDSIPIACELVKDEGITLYLCGGWIMPRISACRGITAESFFQDMRVDKAYNGADSVNVEIGVTSSDYDPRTERAICHSGRECYILADSSKFTMRSYMDKVLAVSEIHHIISDSSLAGGYLDALRRNGIDVILGQAPGQDL